MKMQISFGGKNLKLSIADSFKNILEEKRDPNMKAEEFEKETQKLIEESFKDYFTANEWKELKKLNNGKDVDLEEIDIVEKCGNNCLASCSNKEVNYFEQVHKVFLIRNKFKVFIVLDPKKVSLREMWEENSGINPDCTYDALKQAIKKQKQK